MRVLLTHERFAPDFAGGGELVVLEIAKHLRLIGIDCEVLTTGDPAIQEYEGIPTTRLRRHRYLMNLAAGPIARRAATFDLIQTFNYHACLSSLWAGRRQNKPVVCTMLALFGKAWRKMKGAAIGRVWEEWERMLARQCFDRTVFFSEESRSLGVALGTNPERALVLPPGIDTDAYRPAPIKEDVVLFSGKYETRKGIDTVLEVGRRLPEVRFRLYGWGDQEKHYQTLASPNVEFVPFERDAPLRDQFARARIFLFPTRAETFGLAVLEAMASGCAIVSSAPVDFDGIRVDAEDVDGMTRAVLDLWRSREKTDELGARNVALAQKYSWRRYAQELADVYQSLLRNKASSTTR